MDQDDAPKRGLTSRFVDRAIELRALEDAWSSGRAELVIVHGRRRVGKSALLTRFATRKAVAYYAAAQQLERDQLSDLGLVLGELSSAPELQRGARLAFSDWDELLASLAAIATTRRVGLVLDELPYLVDANGSLPSLIQRWWDRVGSRSNLVLVLSGSQQSMMQRLVSPEGALYGRPTRRLHVLPLDHFHAGRFAPRWSPEDRVRLYAVAGGIPDYLEQLDDRRPLREELMRLAYAADGRLFREAPDLLRSELKEPRTYESVVRAIASGYVTPGTIGDQAGLSGANRVSPYLDRLVDLGLVERRVPPSEASETRPRISQYVLADQYLRFYYALVDPWRSAIQLGQGARVLETIWGERFDRFVSQTFEQVAREHLRRLSGAGLLPPLSSVGFWWFSGGDIDAAGVAEGRLVVAGSAKWTADYVKPADLSDLESAVARVSPGAKPALFLFSRSGFDRHLRGSEARLVGLRDLFRPDLDYERRR